MLSHDIGLKIIKPLQKVNLILAGTKKEILWNSWIPRIKRREEKVGFIWHLNLNQFLSVGFLKISQ